MFVTPRAWPQRRRWEKAKRATRRWKDVRVIAADDLEQWLEEAPAVGAWLAHHLGTTSELLHGIEEVWQEWSLATKPRMSPGIVMAGREDATRKVQQWLLGPPGVLEVQGDSPDEVIAFLYAAIVALPEVDRVKAFARCIATDTRDGMRFAASFSRPLIVAAPAECAEAAGVLVQSGHHVFLSVSAKVLSTRDVLRLPRPPRQAFERALVEAGQLEHDARHLALSCGRSIAVLRRLIPFAGVVQQPEWSQPQIASELLPVLLAGAWSDDEGDRAILSALGGSEYDAVVNKASRWLTTDDAPVQRIWACVEGPRADRHVVSAWTLLVR